MLTSVVVTRTWPDVVEKVLDAYWRRNGAQLFAVQTTSTEA